VIGEPRPRPRFLSLAERAYGAFRSFRLDEQLPGWDELELEEKVAWMAAAVAVAGALQPQEDEREFGSAQ